MTATQLAHFNMIEQQIRPWNVHSPAVLAALECIRREDFVPEAYAQNAFADISIPLPQDGFMLEPKLLARMLQALEIQTEEQAMQIGVGAGYSSALLSCLADRVQVIERRAECVALTQRNLGMAGISNVTVEQGDASLGWLNAGEVDVILMRGAVAEVRPKLFEQLSQGGRLVAVVGSVAPMELMLYQKTSEGIKAHSIVDTELPSLVEAKPMRAFVF